MKKLRIGIDCDGVLYPFAQTFTNYASRRLGVKLPTFVHWNTHQKYWGITHEQMLELMTDALTSGELWKFGHPTDGAKETLWALQDSGHTVVIATDRHLPGHERLAEKVTREWLKQHGLIYDELIFTKDKRDAHADVFLDDRPGAIPTLLLAGTKAVYYDRPWNAWFPYDRVYDFSEFFDYVLKYEKELS